MQKTRKLFLTLFVSVLLLNLLYIRPAHAATGTYKITGPAQLTTGQTGTYTVTYTATTKTTFYFTIIASGAGAGSVIVSDAGDGGTTSGQRQFKVKAGSSAGTIKIDIDKDSEENIDPITTDYVTLTGTALSVKVIEDKPTPTVNKTALQSKLAEAKSYKSADYTSASFSALATAITNAQAVFDNNNATQAQVDTQVSNLNTAISNLKKPEPETPEPSDKTEKVIESIDFDTEYRDDPNLEVGKERVVRAGVKGQVEITYKVSDQSIVNRRIIKQPMAEIIARGTKVVSVSTNLKSLFVDGADISPAFSQTVTKYTFTLREPADTVTVRAEAEATGATVSGTGLVTLTKPSHVQKIVVSRDGQQTTYEVTINQPEDAPVETPSAEIDFNGKTIKVIPIEETILGFEAQTMMLQGQEVPVLSNGKGITVIELEGEGLFLVNSSGTIYSRFNPVLINGTRYFALDIPEEGRDMEQLVYSEFKLGEYTIYGFQYVDETRANYKIFYLQNEEGSIDEYLYNVDDESLVLLKEASFETPVETETIDETTASERLDMQDLVVYAGLIVLGILTIVLLLLVIRRIRERS